MTSSPGRSDTINMLWIGSELGPVEQASAISFVQCGHTVDLYTYREVSGIPPGVNVRDAAEILPWDQICNLRYPSGSYALGANYFRILLQQKSLGFWADLDLICLDAIRIDNDYVAGWEDGEKINNAFLRIAPRHPIVTDLIDLYERPRVPDWTIAPRRKLIAWKLMSSFGMDVRPRVPWGTYGVQALTAVSRRYGASPQPQHVFYPLHWRQTDCLFEPSRSLDEFVREGTLTLHLWNELIRKRLQSGEVPPRDSILGRLFSRYLG